MTLRLRDQAYDHIFKKVVEGILKPGMRLSNRGLAAEIGISPIPVREAISQLVSEGFVEDRAREGAFVKDPSAEELWHLVEMRIALECFTVARVAPLLLPHHFERMTKHNEDLLSVVIERQASASASETSEQVDRKLQADIGFHLVMFDAAENPPMQSLVSSLWVKTHIFQVRFQETPEEPTRVTYNEHCQLIEALRQGDGEGARELMERHIARGYESQLSIRDSQSESLAAEPGGTAALLSRLMHDAR